MKFDPSLFQLLALVTMDTPLRKRAPVALTAVKEFVEQAQQNEEEGPKHIQFFLFNEQMYICYVEVLSKFGFNLFCLIE